jgi:hypothetical protein
MALLLWQTFIDVYDLSDALKEGANFWLLAGSFYPITGRFRMS